MIMPEKTETDALKQSWTGDKFLSYQRIRREIKLILGWEDWEM